MIYLSLVLMWKLIGEKPYSNRRHHINWKGFSKHSGKHNDEMIYRRLSTQFLHIDWLICLDKKIKKWMFINGSINYSKVESTRRWQCVYHCNTKICESRILFIERHFNRYEKDTQGREQQIDHRIEKTDGRPLPCLRLSSERYYFLENSDNRLIYENPIV